MRKRNRHDVRQVDLMERYDGMIRQALVLQRLSAGCIITGGPFPENANRPGQQLRLFRIF